MFVSPSAPAPLPQPGGRARVRGGGGLLRRLDARRQTLLRGARTRPTPRRTHSPPPRRSGRHRLTHRARTHGHPPQEYPYPFLNLYRQPHTYCITGGGAILIFAGIFRVRAPPLPPPPRATRDAVW